ncbi:hypothetical protein RBE51_02760 [Pseudomonas taiwanensis]|uniref:hypothetical protein n=1 Tax=Pseudomonas taiwanensis TaxID=470150 RepID=UPI0028DDB41C|nr:hypothetical protein [Pseudomonas taiwanensis]MDT8921763.1 hypothetical protein [Pseudomonas taiwanensis]
MPRAQHPDECKVYLHPTACTRPSFVEAFQRRTGLQVFTTPQGFAMAAPQDGGRP